ncbi:MAG: aldehyde ferredoxin oxidoreductase N-terminal domain-containing protein [Dehalococcoidia bacterium]
MADFGYAGKILRVDLSSGKIEKVPTSDYAGLFLGGRGLAAKIHWDEVPTETGALEEGNRIIFATGPLGGVPTVGGSRWTVCGKSSERESFSYCNMGGRWGAELKFAGFDAIVIYGESEKPVYLLLEGDRAQLKDASSIWGKGTVESREMLKAEHGKSARVVAIGPAGENMAIMASFLADNDASGSGQLGASVGARKLKAIVVKGTGRKVPIARPDDFRELADYYRSLQVAFPAKDWQQISRWSRDLVLDFRAIPPERMRREPCYGCLGQCARQSYQASDGTTGKFLCHSAYFYQPAAERYYGEWNEVPFRATRLCDHYGIDTKAVDKIMGWLDGHFQAGNLTEKGTGLPLSRIGSLEYIEKLTRTIALREGIGDILAQGLNEAAKLLPADSKPIPSAGLLQEPGFFDPYGARLYITNGFIYAMEPSFSIQQIHEIGMIVARWRTSELGMADCPSDVVRRIGQRFWGSEIAADFTTYEGKALAAKRIQDRQYAKECSILCDFLWPLTYKEFGEERAGDPTLEGRILSAVTGRRIDEEGFRRIGERAFNLQRAILVREGHRGREFDKLDERCFTEPLQYDLSNPDCIVPGPGGETASRKGAVVDRDKWEETKTEYYRLRGWDPATGLQRREHLESLGLPEVADDLGKRGLLAITPKGV